MPSGGGRIKELSEIHQEEVQKMLARFQAQRKEISLSLPGATSRTATHQSPQGCASRDAHRAAESHSPSMARSDEKRADFSTMRHERDRLSQETRLLKAELRGLWDDGSGRDVLECRQDCAAPAGDASLADYLTATRGARHDFSHPSEYSIAGRGSVDAGELQEIADIASLLRTEREIADVATGSGGDADDARRDFEAQREAVSLMQRQLQAQHIEIEARLRDVTAQEKHLQKREAQTNSLQATTGGQLEYKSKEVEAAMQQLQHMQQALAEREADLEQRESMVRDISERESKVKVLEQQASQQAEEAEKKERQQTLQQRALDDRSRKLKEDEDRRIEEADGRQKEQQQIMEERYRQMDEDEKKTRQAALHKLNELIKRETALKTLEKTLDAQQQEAQRLSGRIGEQEKVLQERQRAAVDGRREFESKCEARRRALKEEDLRVSEHAAKVERTKAEVGRMAAKLEHLIQANTSAEQALVDERQVLRNERSSLQDREREATRRVAEAEAASIVRLADIERREHELQRREHELSERQRTCDDMLQQAQRKTEECERNMQQRESICAARDLEYQREREQQARLRSEEQLEAQASLNEALQQVHTLSQSKASAHAALEAHSNLVEALRQQLAEAEARAASKQHLQHLAREVELDKARLESMSKSIDDRGTEREHELQGMAQALEDRQHHLAQRERSASDQLAALTRREQALNAREQELAVSKEEVEARRQQVTRDSDDRANSARRELAQQAQQLASQEEALVAMRQAIDAREDAVRRREDDMAERLGELRDASTTLRELEVRRIQVRDAIDNLSSVQRRQDETLAETRRRQTQVEALEREVGGREEDLAIQERRLEQWHHDIKEHEASLHQHRAAADMAAAKDKTMFNEASEEIRRRMEQLAETAADLEASSRQVQAREAEVAATLARLEAKEKALQEKALQLQHQPSETHSSASVRAPAMSPVRRYSNQDLSAARRNGHDVAVHHLPAPTPSGARRNTGAAAATPLKHDRDVYRVSSSPADELYDSAVHSRYDSAVQSRSAWSRDAHEVDARHAAYAHEVDAAPCLAQSRGVRDERPSRLRASSHLASAHQAASAQPSGAFEAQSSRYTETEREDQDVIQRHIREQLGAVESRAAEVKKNQAQVDMARMELEQQVEEHNSQFAQAEKSIQKRIQKLEKLNFRNQLKSYLSDSSQNTTSTNL